MADDIILHHYDSSPFSEKARLMFGIKGATWRSVIQPTIMPKPDLTPLTGGYRRIPVMQIGADVFCDSQVIMAEIERRFPSPKAIHGADWGVNLWADRLFFQPSVAVIFGAIGDSVPKEFIEDREKLSGRPFDVQAMKAAAIPMKGQFRAMAAWIDQALSGGQPFIAGDAPGLADVSAYMNFWFLGGAQPDEMATLLKGLDKVAPWLQRVRGIGHGTRSEMTTAEAVAVAKAAKPTTDWVHDANDPAGLAPGAKVLVMADDYGREPISGVLVALNTGRAVITREDPAVGQVNVHFPRAGFIVVPAG